MSQVAIITGGASGIGLAVATSLAKKGWHVHIVGLNEHRAQKTADELNGSYSRADVTDYQSLQEVFGKVFQEKGQIDFVFANAGIGETENFYALTTDKDITCQPPGMNKMIDTNLKAVINTSYLARHYMRQNKIKEKASLVINGSIAGLYPVRFFPIYTASKHGVIGFARAIADFFFEDGIRVNTVCPGNVRTNLFKPEVWDTFKMEWIDVSQVVSIVEMMLFDQDMRGNIVEVAPKDFYFHEAPAYKTDNVRITLDEPTFKSLGK
ncbi:NAD(P)-binding protein [Corynespora cassiicola Philippines]|uniref:NAD(P)-binding protein n=1 Tax=Corynespora cassiicola Philippines TaxID=1448308 RepID=A0A2T2P8E1_CORCC|nr:NAD(P)-binding protein [Corynespora cassiicola Philippines]